MHSYVCSPLPTVGSFEPALSAAPRIVGPAAANAAVAADTSRKRRRVEWEREDIAKSLIGGREQWSHDTRPRARRSISEMRLALRSSHHELFLKIWPFWPDFSPGFSTELQSMRMEAPSAFR